MPKDLVMTDPATPSVEPDARDDVEQLPDEDVAIELPIEENDFDAQPR
jgi:hypothetical protein